MVLRAFDSAIQAEALMGIFSTKAPSLVSIPIAKFFGRQHVETCETGQAIWQEELWLLLVGGKLIGSNELVMLISVGHVTTMIKCWNNIAEVWV